MRSRRTTSIKLLQEAPEMGVVGNLGTFDPILPSLD